MQFQSRTLPALHRIDVNFVGRQVASNESLSCLRTHPISYLINFSATR